MVILMQDVSNICEVPDHQEVFVDLDRDESLIIEILEMKHDVADNTSATWFQQDLATVQGAEGNISRVEPRWLIFPNKWLLHLESMIGTCLVLRPLINQVWWFLMMFLFWISGHFIAFGSINFLVHYRFRMF